MTGMSIGIVGTGPSGAAAARYLADAGFQVTIIDAGLTIEPDLAPLGELRPPVDRDAFMTAVNARRRQSVTTASTLPPKLPFGSDFVYRTTPAGRLSEGSGLHIETSLAQGGLSNAWGANVCAVAGRDMAGWPIREDDLAPYYRALEAVLDVSGEVDGIDSLYTAALAAKPHYPLSLHGQRILAAAAGHRERMAAAGLRYGRAKIAVGPKWSVDGVGCVPCSLCMHGCPHNAIFNAADVVRDLSHRPNVRRLDGRFVLRFEERSDGVTVVCRPIGGGETEEHRFDRLLIGAGVFGSTTIVARSLGLCDRDFIIHDSQKYYFPFFRLRGAEGAVTERTNTLAQIFIQDVGLRSTPRTVHCQLYGINDLVFETLEAKFGPLAKLLRRFGGIMFERMMIGMVYFHSDDSGDLIFRPSAREEDGMGQVTAGPRPDARPIFREFMGRLRRFAPAFGGLPVGLLAEDSPPGHSMHFGGSLPMSSEGAPGRTDALGRPYGCRRVHVVDASVLPSIPGTPTVYVLMANAMRIAAGAVAA